MSANTITRAKFDEIIARLREKKALDANVNANVNVNVEYELTTKFIPIPLTISPAVSHVISPPQQDSFIALQDFADNTDPVNHNIETTDKHGKTIIYNDKQQRGVDLISSGKSCIIVGAAGTGKTTLMKGGVAELVQSIRSRILQAHDHKFLPHGVPGIIVCAYTRRATSNIRKNLDTSMQSNCITIHKTLEYGPEFFEVTDPLSGRVKNSMRFVPYRNKSNPLPQEVFAIVFEESSMISVALYDEVSAALPSSVQQIFLGDIQQLPPIFGAAILGFKMLQLPVVELTEVYRQALNSPIIRLAHRIISGKPISASELATWDYPGELKIAPWKKEISDEGALEVTKKLFSKYYDSGDYKPGTDMILIPFNKGYGTIELNRHIANHIARAKNLVTFEVIAGFVKHYFSEGDTILFDREDATILSIVPNPSYTGISPQHESNYLDYWGHDATPRAIKVTYNESSSGEDIDFLLAAAGSADAEDRVSQSSHHIRLLMEDSGTEYLVTKAAEVNAIMLGYALTVHKAQGSEWEKVFFLLHSSHNTMLMRELLYTAVTRAKKQLIVICEKDSFVKGIIKQRIKGDTIEEKAEWFKGKLDAKEMQS